MRHSIGSILSLLLLLLVACGGSQASELVFAPFTAEHEPVFENGLDMVRDPGGLGGAWLTSWEEELDRRVSLADAVALVTVTTIRTDTDLDRRDTFRLVTRVDREYLGELDDEVTFAVAEGESGYSTVETNERRLLDQQFFAFVKWQREDDGGRRPRWHLSPATDAVARRVRRLLRDRRQVVSHDGTRRTVVIHRN